MSTSPTELRLADSNGRLIQFGDLIKRKTNNHEVHGAYCYHRVVSRRGVPAISYLMSDAGYVLPPDYTCGALSDMYDPKQLWWAPDDRVIEPMDDDVFVITEAELPYPLVSEADWSAQARARRQAHISANAVIATGQPETNPHG